MAASKFTDEARSAILTGLRAGMFRKPAAKKAGISIVTLHNWLKRGEAVLERLSNDEPVEYIDEEYASFTLAVYKAEAEAEEDAVTQITTAAKRGTWQAAAWYLERKWPERWATRKEAHTEAPVEKSKSNQEEVDEYDAAFDELVGRTAERRAVPADGSQAPQDTGARQPVHPTQAES